MLNEYTFDRIHVTDRPGNVAEYPSRTIGGDLCDATIVRAGRDRKGVWIEGTIETRLEVKSSRDASDMAAETVGEALDNTSFSDVRQML